MPEGYKLWVNTERTVLVRQWDGRDEVEVATRPDSDAIWGPPVEALPEPAVKAARRG
jgi:hypothetical protein